VRVDGCLHATTTSILNEPRLAVFFVIHLLANTAFWDELRGFLQAICSFFVTQPQKKTHCPYPFLMRHQIPEKQSFFSRVGIF